MTLPLDVEAPGGAVLAMPGETGTAVPSGEAKPAVPVVWLDTAIARQENDLNALLPASSVSTGERCVPTSFIPLRDRDGRVVAVSLVDADVAPALLRWAWHLNSHGYVVRSECLPNGTQWQLSLHRVVMCCAYSDQTEIDHISRDKLDNRRANLRFVTHLENVANSDAVGKDRRAAYGDSARARRRSGALGFRLCRNHLHEMTPENTLPRTSANNRRCRACADAYRRSTS